MFAAIAGEKQPYIAPTAGEITKSIYSTFGILFLIMMLISAEFPKNVLFLENFNQFLNFTKLYLKRMHFVMEVMKFARPRLKLRLRTTHLPDFWYGKRPF